jgi:hypothetical protein
MDRMARRGVVSKSVSRYFRCQQRSINDVKSEWALLLPAYVMFLVLLTYFIYFALAFSETPKFSDITTIIGALTLKILT